MVTFGPPDARYKQTWRFTIAYFRKWFHIWGTKARQHNQLILSFDVLPDFNLYHWRHKVLVYAIQTEQNPVMNMSLPSHLMVGYFQIVCGDSITWSLIKRPSQLYFHNQFNSIIRIQVIDFLSCGLLYKDEAVFWGTPLEI